MRNRATIAVLVVSLSGGSPSRGADETGPRETGLIEQVRTRLVQIDVTVSGPPDVIPFLDATDFVVKINLTEIRGFRVDQHCPVPPGATATARSTPAPVNYLFYFDQPHMTLSGRQGSLDQARRLIPLLIVDGSRGMIVSNARRLAVIHEFTTEPELLLAALERLSSDRTQWDTFAEDEASRVAEVVSALNQEQSLDRASHIARMHQREERWRTEKNLRRLSLTLSRLAALDPPKAVLYFADTMRSGPGDHYLSFFGRRTVEQSEARAFLTTGAFAAALSFDGLVNEAAAEGIRFYTIRAEGLVTPFDRTAPGGSASNMTGTVSTSSWTRYRDAETTLSSLAAETGGRAFLDGTPAPKVAQQILGDFACMYVISFDPVGWAEDAPLRAVVKMRREGVRIRSRGRLVVQSEATRLAAHLESAFMLGGAGGSDLGLRAMLVPTGFDGGSYSALLQISVPRSALTAATWDVGASLVSRDKVQQEVSGRLSVRQPNVPVILEQEVRVKPRPYEIRAVAHETGGDFVLSEHVAVDWPDPDLATATCGPVTVFQPVEGAFSRDGIPRKAGSMALPPGEAVRTDLPAVVVGLVCRGRKQKGVLNVEHWLERDTRVQFPPLLFELGDERCAQIRDVIPPRTLEPGAYRYGIRVLEDGEPRAEISHEFFAVDPG